MMNLGSLINTGIVFTLLFVFVQSEAQVVKIDSVQDIQLKCFGYKLNKCFLLNSKEELQGIMTGWSNHPACSDYQLPEIDFTRYSLILFSGSYTGCEKPDYELEILKDNASKKLVFKLSVREISTCRMVVELYFQKVIPKTNYTLEEQISVIHGVNVPFER